VTKPKTASELEALIRDRSASQHSEMALSIAPVDGQTPNWTCIVRYADPGHGMGPDDAFVEAVAALQRRFHLAD
jgi:hypothetical protein